MGRPSKSDAMTPAERMRAYRSRKAQGVTEKIGADRAPVARRVTEKGGADRAPARFRVTKTPFPSEHGPIPCSESTNCQSWVIYSRTQIARGMPDVGGPWTPIKFEAINP